MVVSTIISRSLADGRRQKLTCGGNDGLGPVLKVFDDIVVQVRLVREKVKAGVEGIFGACVGDDGQRRVLGRLLVVRQQGEVGRRSRTVVDDRGSG